MPIIDSIRAFNKSVFGTRQEKEEIVNKAVRDMREKYPEISEKLGLKEIRAAPVVAPFRLDRRVLERAVEGIWRQLEPREPESLSTEGRAAYQKLMDAMQSGDKPAIEKAYAEFRKAGGCGSSEPLEPEPLIKATSPEPKVSNVRVQATDDKGKPVQAVLLPPEGKPVNTFSGKGKASKKN